MTSMSDIVTAINKAVEKEFPDDMFYIDLLPLDFERPSTLLELTQETRKDVNKNTVSVVAQFLITCFATTDEHYNSSTAELTKKMDTIMDIFRSGYLEVGDRCIGARTATGRVAFDEATATIEFDFFDDRGLPEDTGPLMEAVKTNIRQEG